MVAQAVTKAWQSVLAGQTLLPGRESPGPNLLRSCDSESIGLVAKSTVTRAERNGHTDQGQHGLLEEHPSFQDGERERHEHGAVENAAKPRRKRKCFSDLSRKNFPYLKEMEEAKVDMFKQD